MQGCGGRRRIVDGRLGACSIRCPVPPARHSKRKDWADQDLPPRPEPAWKHLPVKAAISDKYAGYGRFSVESAVDETGRRRTIKD